VTAKRATVEFQGGPLEGIAEIDLEANYNSLGDDRKQYAFDAISYASEIGVGMELLVLLSADNKSPKTPYVCRIESYEAAEIPKAVVKFVGVEKPSSKPKK